MDAGAAARRLAETQHGVITRAQFAACGLSSAGVSRAAVGGELRRVCQGVYLVGGAPLTRRAHWWAAVLATDGLLGFATAAKLWELTEQEDERVHVAVPHGRRVTVPPGVRVHRVPVPPEARRRIDGLPVCSRPWTALDHLGALRGSQAGTFFDRALQQGWLTSADVHGRLRDWRGRIGNTQLRRLATTLHDGAAAESERRLHRILRDGGIGGWVPNYAVRTGTGTVVAVLDVAFPELQLALEIDGMAHHVDAKRFRDDRQRQNQIVLLGWTVLRFTWADLTERPQYVLEAVQRSLAAQHRKFGSVPSSR